MLLFQREGQGHFATRPEGVHHLGPGKEKVESFTVQPKFEGNADDFGMVIPTPSKPKLDEMPRDFFKELAVYSILKKREQPQSKLLPFLTTPRDLDADDCSAPRQSGRQGS